MTSAFYPSELRREHASRIKCLRFTACARHMFLCVVPYGPPPPPKGSGISPRLRPFCLLDEGLLFVFPLPLMTRLAFSEVTRGSLWMPIIRSQFSSCSLVVLCVLPRTPAPSSLIMLTIPGLLCPPKFLFNMRTVRRFTEHQFPFEDVNLS